MTGQRIASIWLPRLAIERWLKSSGASDEDRAEHGLRVVLVVEAAHGQMVHAATAAAGVQRGTRLTDARALDPGLQAVAADVAGDADLLARLATALEESDAPAAVVTSAMITSTANSVPPTAVTSDGSPAPAAPWRTSCWSRR